MDDAARISGHGLVVGHEDDGVALLGQRPEQAHDFDPGLGVEVAGRLVGEHDRGPVGERPGDGHALRLAAGELIGIVGHSVFEADHLEQFGGAFLALADRYAGVQHRELDVGPG